MFFNKSDSHTLTNTSENAIEWGNVYAERCTKVRLRTDKHSDT